MSRLWPIGPRERLDIAFGPLLDIGAMTASAGPLRNQETRRDLWVAVGGTLGLHLALSQVAALSLALEGFGSAKRPRFVINGVEDFYVTRPGGARLVLGFELRFGGKKQ